MYVIYIIMLYQTHMTFFCGTQKKEKLFFFSPMQLQKMDWCKKKAIF